MNKKKTDVEKWIEAEAEYWRARDARDEALFKALPVGKVVTIRRGRGTQRVRILGHSSNRVKVLNQKTFKEYWVNSFWMLPKFGGDPE